MNTDTDALAGQGHDRNEAGQEGSVDVHPDELIGFLRARLDEDAQAARAAGGGRWRYVRIPGDTAPDGHTLDLDDQRVLREVESKRRMLNWIERIRDWANDNNLWTYDESEPLKLLALPYSDHEDYQEGWRL